MSDDYGKNGYYPRDNDIEVELDPEAYDYGPNVDNYLEAFASYDEGEDER